MKCVNTRLLVWILGTVVLAIYITLRYKLYAVCQSLACVAIKGALSLFIATLISIAATALFLLTVQIKTRASIRRYFYKKQVIH